MARTSHHSLCSAPSGPTGGGLVHGVRRRRRLVSAVAVAAAVPLAACTDGGSSQTPTTTTPSKTTATVPGPSASPPRSPSPSLSSKQQAAAEAKSATLSYRKTVDRVFQSGGRLKADLANVAIAGQLSFLNKQADALAEQRQRQVGDVELTSIRVVTIASGKDRAPSAIVEACADSTRRKVVDSSGNNLLPAGIPTTFINTLTLVRTAPGKWLVAAEKDRRVKKCG
jgi:hypothetical protein